MNQKSARIFSSMIREGSNDSGNSEKYPCFVRHGSLAIFNLRTGITCLLQAGKFTAKLRKSEVLRVYVSSDARIFRFYDEYSIIGLNRFPHALFCQDFQLVFPMSESFSVQFRCLDPRLISCRYIYRVSNQLASCRQSIIHYWYQIIATSLVSVPLLISSAVTHH